MITEIASYMPLYVMAISLVAALLIKLSQKSPNVREFWTIAAAVAKFAAVASMLPVILDGKQLVCELLVLFPGLKLAFRVDPLNLFFALTASFLWIVTSFYSISYMRAEREHAQTRYFMCFAVALSATMGIAFSDNLLTMFVFYEVLTLSTFPLVGHMETEEALQGARRYLTYLLGTSLSFLLAAVMLTYYTAGTLDFVPGGMIPEGSSKVLVTVMFVFFIAGTAKAGMMPLHAWLPSAMVAPTPVSALLHAVAVVKSGVFVIVKIVLYVFGVDLLARLGLGHALTYFACFTIVTASILALRQDNLKARLAYSTISQLSYIVLGAALLTPSGVTGGIMHIVIHAFGKITLFFAAGAIYVASHKKNISELDGIGRRMPFTMGAFALATISMIGVPPLGGFISKWYLVLGAIEADELPVLLVLAASTLLNAAYFLPIVYRAFFRKPADSEEAGLKEAPAVMVAALTFTACGALVSFFHPNLFLRLTSMVVAATTGGTQ